MAAGTAGRVTRRRGASGDESDCEHAADAARDVVNVASHPKASLHRLEEELPEPPLDANPGLTGNGGFRGQVEAGRPVGAPGRGERGEALAHLAVVLVAVDGGARLVLLVVYLGVLCGGEVSAVGGAVAGNLIVDVRLAAFQRDVSPGVSCPLRHALRNARLLVGVAVVDFRRQGGRGEKNARE